MRGTDAKHDRADNRFMAQALDTSISQDASALEKRIEELESVLRTVLQQINTHQVYDLDARGLIKRTLGASPIKNTPAVEQTPVRRPGEFPSLFPSSSPPNFI